jgi:predicted AlkP superfamily phosphohydrolase/phosphomutase
MKSKMMVIGWDSSDFNLILSWIKQGHMPNINRLMENGKWAKLRSVYPPVTASAWSTIITGKNAGKHGIAEFMQFRPKSYDVFPLNASHRAGRDVWEILSELGKRVVVVGVPLTYPVRKVNGYMISGFMTPNDNVEYSYPKDLKVELRSKIPRYSVSPSHVHDRNMSDDDYVKWLFEVLNDHIEGALYLAKNKQWDFFMAVFNETDWCQHRFWSAIDPNHPWYSPSRAKRYGHIIRDVHIKLDKALGELLAIAGPETNTMVLSDHGVGPLYKILNTNLFLYKIGKLKLKRTPGTFSRFTLARLGIDPVSMFRNLKTIRAGKSVSLATASKHIGLLKKIFLSKDDIDWSRTEAFALFGQGQIFINRIGVFPNGTVNETKYTQIVSEIVDELKKVRNENGVLIVDKIFRREELFKGPLSEKCPDIQFYTVPGYSPGGSFSFGATNILTGSYDVSGAHSMDGIVVLSQAGFAGSKRAINDADLMDITPTILHLMGIPIPSDMDGKVLSDYETNDAPVLIQQHEQYDKSSTPNGFTKEEEKDIEDHLRSLGYI